MLTLTLASADLKVDVDGLDAEQRRNLNKLGIRYGISSGAFSSLLKMDRREQDETHQLKEIEKAKLALAVCNSFIQRLVVFNLESVYNPFCCISFK